MDLRRTAVEVEPSAQGDGDPRPLTVADLQALRDELVARFAPPASAEPEPFTCDEHGRYVAPKGYREHYTRIGPDRYEHVGEDKQGRWVYAKS